MMNDLMLTDARLNLMHCSAKIAMENAYCSYSGFSVGACVSTYGQDMYNGCNVENSSFGLTQCAERNAICGMITSGYRFIESIVVVSDGKFICAPCGACLQCISEFSDERTVIYLANRDDIVKRFTIAELLPHAFTKKHIR